MARVAVMSPAHPDRESSHAFPGCRGYWAPRCWPRLWRQHSTFPKSARLSGSPSARPPGGSPSQPSCKQERTWLRAASGAE